MVLKVLEIFLKLKLQMMILQFFLEPQLITLISKIFLNYTPFQWLVL